MVEARTFDAGATLNLLSGHPETYGNIPWKICNLCLFNIFVECKMTAL